MENDRNQGSNAGSNHVVRAKFAVTTHQPQGQITRIVMTPQYDASIEEDRRFSEATPSGQLEMLVTNEHVIKAMPVGRQFYLDFTPVGLREHAGATGR